MSPSGPQTASTRHNNIGSQLAWVELIQMMCFFFPLKTISEWSRRVIDLLPAAFRRVFPVISDYIKPNAVNGSSSSSMSCPVPIPGLNKTINVPTGLFINNEFVPSIDSQELIQFVIIFLLLLAMVR